MVTTQGVIFFWLGPRPPQVKISNVTFWVKISKKVNEVKAFSNNLMGGIAEHTYTPIVWPVILIMSMPVFGIIISTNTSTV